jgi:hypothetical protein
MMWEQEEHAVVLRRAVKQGALCRLCWLLQMKSAASWLGNGQPAETPALSSWGHLVLACLVSNGPSNQGEEESKDGSQPEDVVL